MKKTAPCGSTKDEKDRARWTELDDSSTLFTDEVAWLFEKLGQNKDKNKDKKDRASWKDNAQDGFQPGDFILRKICLGDANIFS